MPKTSTRVEMAGAPGSAATARPPSTELIPASQADVPPAEARINQIARRAHEIYETRGGTEGKALEDWLQAEREIDEATGTR